MKKFNTVRKDLTKVFLLPFRKYSKSMRTIIKKACPEAEEIISYNMPAFKLKKVLVYYAAWKRTYKFADHISMIFSKTN